MFYIYDDLSNIIKKQAEQPIDNYGVSDMDFDLENYNYIIGAIDDSKNITYYTRKPKPAEQLINNIKILQSANNTLGQQVTNLTLSNAQKDEFIKQIGQQVTALTLDVATLKGGNK